MDERNYGSLEACQRLHAAGIVLETDMRWYKGPGYTRLYESGIKSNLPSVPAPSMAEVWRMLPITHQTKNFGNTPLIMMAEEDGQVVVGYGPIMLCQIVNTNPTDALIDLLIWTVEQRKEEHHDRQT